MDEVGSAFKNMSTFSDHLRRPCRAQDHYAKAQLAVKYDMLICSFLLGWWLVCSEAFNRIKMFIISRLARHKS